MSAELPSRRNDAAHPLDKGLRLRLRAWRKGRLRVLLLKAFAGWCAAMALLALLDAFFPLESLPRFLCVAGLTILAVGWYLVRSFPIRRTSLEEAAAQMDGLLQDERLSLLSALELKNRSGESVSDFLRGKQIADAQLGFSDLPANKCRPRRQLRAAWIGLWYVVGVIFLLVLWQPTAAWVLAGRLLVPQADIPPYSKLRFTILPENPQVVYGGTLELGVRIDGDTVRGPVYLLTRLGNEIRREESFRGQNQEFVQRLEQVVQNLEFAFATGNARSRWHSIDLLLEPRFALARFSITPPEYTREGSREALLGSEELRGVEGSEARLSITSNRPLSSGTLTIQPHSGAPEQMISGQSTGVHTVEFRWLLASPANLEVQIRDVLGTPAPEPLKIRQRVAPDAKPRVFLSEPGPHVLATSRTVLPVSGGASDDFALQRVSFIRGMPGFRERTAILEDNMEARRFDFESELDLSRLGVQPGDVIEMYLEARDHNPNLTGIETSSVHRVEIITEDEFAERLRMEITLQELQARMQQMLETLREAKESIREAQAQAGDAETAEEAGEAVKTATEKVAEAARKFEQWSEDFVAFEMEQAMEEFLRETASALSTAATRMDQLGQALPSPPDAASELGKILESLDPTENLENTLAQNLEDLEGLEDLMRLAAEFRILVEEQKRLARWADRIFVMGATDPASMAAVQREQERLRERLETLPEQIREAAEKVPDREEMRRLRDDAMDFCDALESCGAQESMDSAVLMAKNANSQRTAHFTELAAEQLEKLLERESQQCEQQGLCQFAGLCNGGGGGSGGGLGGTMGQLVQGMLGRMGLGGGAGMGGADGYAVAQNSMMPLPLIGPNRTRINPPPNRATVESFGSIGDGRPGSRQLEESGQIQTAAPQDAASESSASFDPRRVPEKYRSAIRNYFSLPEPNIAESE